MLQKLYQYKHPSLAFSLNAMGVIYKELGLRLGSEWIKLGIEEYLQVALKMFKDLYPGPHPYTAKVLYNIASAYDALGNTWKRGECNTEEKKMWQALNLKNPVGNGMKDYTKSSYWNQYAKEGLEQLLKLRLESLDIKNVNIKSFNYAWEDLSFVAAELYLEINNITVEDSKFVLLPLNLYGRHWIGIILNIDAFNETVTITYLDSEQNEVSIKLKEILIDAIVECIGYDVNWVYQKLEIQRSNNCGPETIENFICYFKRE